MRQTKTVAGSGGSHAGRGHQKVTDAQVIELMTRHDNGELIKHLAKEAGIAAGSLGTRFKRLRAENNPETVQKQPIDAPGLQDRVDELEKQLGAAKRLIRAMSEDYKLVPVQKWKQQ